MTLKPTLLKFSPGFLTLTFTLLCSYGPLASQTTVASRRLVTQKVDETKMVATAHNIHPDANFKNDRGIVADDMKLDHMVLLLQRPAERETALDAYIESAHRKGSPNYHRWLTADQIGSQFGPDPSDIAAVNNWLQIHGFQVNNVSKSGTLIDFSGTAGQVLEAFKTEVHHVQIKGELHIANFQTPKVPAALSNIVVGISSIHDFRPHASVIRPTQDIQQAIQGPGPKPADTVNSSYQLLAPADFAEIYNMNPLYRRGITGRGQTVVAIEPTNVYSADDVNTYRKTLVPGFHYGSFTQMHPGGCADPGLDPGWEFEAAVDMESITASAPDAKVVNASCASTSANFGSYIALQNVIDERVPPSIISISVASCEAGLTESGNKYINSMYQQAVAEGISIFVSSSDGGAAGCDDFDTATSAVFGIAVNGLASTKYNVAVGGTDFGDTYLKTNSQYWNTQNSATYGSALSYIPEIPWNDSCASSLITDFVGYSTSYGASGFCNSAEGANFLNIVAGSGGPSGCAFGATSPDDGTPAVSGTCQGRPKPIWQYGLVGVPNDGVRDIPDVSLFAANGTWGHYYIFCFSDASQGGSPCTGDPSTWGGGGGTSASAPLMAGVQALIDQRNGGRQGNPNYVLYSLAQREYGWFGNKSCDSTKGKNACIFHDVTLGDNDVDCTTTNSCYTPSGTYGVLSVSSNRFKDAYKARTGWDFATGIGTLNVTKLADNWNNAFWWW